MKYNDLIIIWTLGYYFQHNEDEKLIRFLFPSPFLPKVQNSQLLISAIQLSKKCIPMASLKQRNLTPADRRHYFQLLPRPSVYGLIRIRTQFHSF